LPFDALDGFPEKLCRFLLHFFERGRWQTDIPEKIVSVRAGKGEQVPFLTQSSKIYPDISISHFIKNRIIL
jgi:hypothetical protein